MSRYCANKDSAPILAAAEQWRERCLVNQGAVFSDARLWNQSNIAEVRMRFGVNASEGNDRFIEKLENQLSDGTAAVKQLSAEILWLMLLCPSNIRPIKKRETIVEVYAWSGSRLDTDHPLLSDATLGGVGSAGTAYNNYRPREAAYCTEVVSRFQAEPAERQQALLADGWRFAEWLEPIPENESRQFRNMILFMLFPDEFERIFGGTDRRMIISKVEGLARAQVRRMAPVEVDRKLVEIRARKAADSDKADLDFYVPPLSELWKDRPTSTYLLTWNPANWTWESLGRDRETTAAGKMAMHRWACANRGARVGDKVYLAQTGANLRGIIARGNIVSPPHLMPHWDPSRAANGEQVPMIEVNFTQVRDSSRDAYLTSDDLKQITKGAQEWAPQRSGIAVDPEAAVALDEAWEALPPVQIDPGPHSLGEPENVVLYGPPGTGKTHQLRNKIRLYTAPAVEPEAWRDLILGEMKWYEVVFCALHAIGEPVKVSDLAVHEFVKRKAQLLGRTKNLNNTLWATLQTRALRESKTVAIQKRIEPLAFDKDSDSRWHLAGNWKEELAELVDTAIALERGPTGQSSGARRYEFVTFHQAYSYEDFVEGIRPHETEEDGGGDVGYSVRPGVFRRICHRAKADPKHRYAIFIDEINRGNIAKILGELITLIEPDKRAVYDEDGTLLSGMEVTLPYSGDTFGVPGNLDIVATMNTADRSISLLDTALRRRFRFEELMPDPGVISGVRGDGLIPDGEGGEIDLRALLSAINRRMKFLLNRDQMLGHAYFMEVKSFDDLRSVMLQQIVPLLQEYFYDDWHRIQLVLRDIGPSGDALGSPIICHEIMRETDVLGLDHEDFEDVVDYWVAPTDDVTPDSIRKIYEND